MRQRRGDAVLWMMCTTRGASPSTWAFPITWSTRRSDSSATWCVRLSTEYLAGTHADSLLSLQQPHQVRPIAEDGAQHWRGADCHRALRGERVRRDARALDFEAARGSQEGPDVFSLWADAGAVGAYALSVGPHDQAGGARGGAAARIEAGREARLAGDLLHSRRRLQAVSDGVSRRAGRDDAGDGGRAGGVERRGRSGGTKESPTSPWASARDWAWLRLRRSTC